MSNRVDQSRYKADEINPRLAKDETSMDAYIERNRDALNKALEAGYVSLENNEGIAARCLEDLLLALKTARTRY